MTTCYRCGKSIRGQVTHHIPPVSMIRAGLDFHKTFHPKCYVAEEADALRELYPAAETAPAVRES